MACTTVGEQWKTRIPSYLSTQLVRKYEPQTKGWENEGVERQQKLFLGKAEPNRHFEAQDVASWMCSFMQK